MSSRSYVVVVALSILGALVAGTAKPSPHQPQQLDEGGRAANGEERVIPHFRVHVRATDTFSEEEIFGEPAPQRTPKKGDKK